MLRLRHPSLPQAQPPAHRWRPRPAPGGTAPASPREPPQEPPTEAERLIDLAIKKVAGLKSVSADMVQNVVMLKQKFDIKGRYLKAPDSRTYLKLTVSGLPDSDGTMLQVCDGETLWEYQQILESQSLPQDCRIKPIFERLNSPDIDAKTRDQILNQMGFAGPDALLVGLRKSVRFDQKEEGTLDGKAVWVLRGTWRNRNGLVGPDQRPLPATGPLTGLRAQSGHALPGQGRWLALQDGPGRQGAHDPPGHPPGRSRRQASSALAARSRRSMPARSSSSTRTSSSTRQSAPRSSRSRRPPTRPSRTTPRSSSRALTRPSRFRPCKNEPRLPARKAPSSTSPSKSPNLPPIRHPNRPREPDFRTHVIPGDQRVDSRRDSHLE